MGREENTSQANEMNTIIRSVKDVIWEKQGLGTGSQGALHLSLGSPASWDQDEVISTSIVLPKKFFWVFKLFGKNPKFLANSILYGECDPREG